MNAVNCTFLVVLRSRRFRHHCTIHCYTGESHQSAQTPRTPRLRCLHLSDRELYVTYNYEDNPVLLDSLLDRELRTGDLSSEVSVTRRLNLRLARQRRRIALEIEGDAN